MLLETTNFGRELEGNAGKQRRLSKELKLELLEGGSCERQEKLRSALKVNLAILVLVCSIVGLKKRNKKTVSDQLRPCLCSVPAVSVREKR